MWPGRTHRRRASRRLRLLALALASAPNGAAVAGGEAAPRAPPQLEIRDWMAVGSGCRARRAEPGDVRIILRDPQEERRIQVLVELPGYGLEGDRPAAPGAADFARECAIRLAVHPAPGKRIKSFAASAAFRVRKDGEAKVRLRSRLLVGDATLDRREEWIAGGETAAERDVSLPGERARREGFFRRLACERPKVVGFDLSATVFRESAHPAVSVGLAGHRASLTLEIEDCLPAEPQGRPP